MTLVVTPDTMRSTKQAIESALEQATAIANEYLSSHENIASGVWQGRAQLASLNTASQLNHDLMQVMAGANRLSHGLGQAAALMEHHEEEAAHHLNNFSATNVSL